MDVERLPSGKFQTNALVLRNAMLAFNILRKIVCDLLSFPGDLPVKFDVARRRIKSVIQNIVNVADRRSSKGKGSEIVSRNGKKAVSGCI